MGTDADIGTRRLRLALYGPFRSGWSDGTPLDLKGTKSRLLICLLARAPHGTRSRHWLQEHLWSRSGQDHGRASLRRALSDLRKRLGSDFDQLFLVTNQEVTLRLNTVDLIGGPADGEFLEGVGIDEPLFSAWLQKERNAGAQNPDARLLPGLAILPFASATRTPHDQHFGDLLAQDIGRAASRTQMIEVISHLSSRQFTGLGIDTSQVVTALDAQFALLGHVRLRGGSFHLDADFVDLASGRMLWSRPFKGAVSDVLQGQSQIVADIASACGREILRQSIELGATRPLPEVESHALFMAAVTGIHQQVWPSFSRAKEQLEELARRLPHHSVLHAWQAKWHVMSISQGWSVDPRRDMARAQDCTARALDADPHCATSLTIDGMIQGDQKSDLSVAGARFDAALQVNPNHALAWLMSSRMHSYLGQADRALETAQKARRLSPVDPHGYFYDIMESMAHLVAGQAPQAIALAERSIAANPRHASSLRVLAMAQSQAGEAAAAHQTVEKLLQLEPNLTVRGYLASHPAGKLPIGAAMAEMLAEAGVPR